MVQKQIIFGFLGALSFSYAAEAADVVLNISEAKSNKGSIIGTLWNSEEAYLDLDARQMRASAKIISGKAVMRMEGLAAGTYSIALYHDENGNDKMDTNFIGIPKEGWAFSNNAKGSFGPPSFEKTSFTVAADDVVMDIVMNY